MNHAKVVRAALAFTIVALSIFYVLTEPPRLGLDLRGGTQITLESRDSATVKAGTGNSGQGKSFQSVNFPGRFIRNFNNVVYLAANGGSNPWDTATGWPVDTTWLVATPWAQAPGGNGGGN